MKQLKSRGLMGLENVKWLHLLAKVTLPVPTKPVLLQKKDHYVPSQHKVNLI